MRPRRCVVIENQRLYFDVEAINLVITEELWVVAETVLARCLRVLNVAGQRRFAAFLPVLSLGCENYGHFVAGERKF
jgi:hypothetical protein